MNSLAIILSVTALAAGLSNSISEPTVFSGSLDGQSALARFHMTMFASAFDKATATDSIKTATSSLKVTKQSPATSASSDLVRLAIEYPQTEIELPNVGMLTKLFSKPTVHHRIPTQALSTSSLTSSVHHSLSSDSSENFDVVVEITLRGTNRDALRRPLVVTLDPLLPSESATSSSEIGQTPDLNVASWDSATPTSGDLAPTPTGADTVPMATVHRRHHHHDNQADRQQHASTTLLLPSDDASQLASHIAHKAKLEHIEQALQTES